MDEENRQRLIDWAQNLSHQLGVDSAALREALDIDDMLDLAGVAAHSILRPAAPITTFLVGYAAGLASAAGVDVGSAVRKASDTADAAAVAAGGANPPGPGE